MSAGGGTTDVDRRPQSPGLERSPRGKRGLPRNGSSPWLLGTGVLVLALLTAVLTSFAYEWIFSTWKGWDDDGYLIITMREFAQGGGLYEGFASHYGPGLFVLVAGAMDLVGVAFSHDGARWVNLAAWAASTFAAGLIILYLTRDVAIAVGGCALSFLVLAVNANEPLHPGAVIGLLLLGIVAVGSFLFSRRPRVALGLIGAVAVAILSIKVNVGGLALLSAACACVLASAPLQRPRMVRYAVLASFVLAPLVLLAPRLDEAPIARYALLVSAGGLALVLASLARRKDERPNWPDALWLPGGAVLALLFVVCATLISGTGGAALIEGWFGYPQRMLDFPFVQLGFDSFDVIWACAGVAVAIAVHALGKREASATVIGVVGALRIVLGIAIWFALAGQPLGLAVEPARALALALPFAWVAAIPPGGQDNSAPLSFGRILLPALAVLQTLHAFPVAGSQLGWSQFLFVLVAAVCISDGLHQIGDARVATRNRALVLRGVGSAAVLTFVVWVTVNPVDDFRKQASGQFEASVPVNLPGAERMRQPPDRVAQFTEVTAYLERHCSEFVTLPGLNSFHLFTQSDPPEILNGPWPLWFTADEQHDLVERIRGNPTLCALRDKSTLDFWSGLLNTAPPPRPLLRFIRSEFRTAEAYGPYELMLRRSPGAGGSRSESTAGSSPSR